MLRVARADCAGLGTCRVKPTVVPANALQLQRLAGNQAVQVDEGATEYFTRTVYQSQGILRSGVYQDQYAAVTKLPDRGGREERTG